MTHEKLIESVKNSKIIKKNDYSYIIHPLLDGIEQIESELLNIAVDDLEKLINTSNYDKIVTIEAMGVPVASALCLKTKKPFTIIRKRPYHLKNEQEIKQKTGYSKSNLYVNGINKSEKIVIIDDVLSTGGTVIPVIQCLKDFGVDITGVFFVVDKGDIADEIRKKFNIRVESLIKIKIVDNEIIIQ